MLIYKKVTSIFSAIADFIKNVVGTIINWVKTAVDWVTQLIDKLGWVAYLIPGLAQIKMGQNIAKAFSGSVNNNSVRQSQTVNNTSTTTTNNNYFGNTNTYNGMFGMSGAIYAPARP